MPVSIVEITHNFVWVSGSRQNITLFNALFKGRDDVFAKRWETKDKSGYAPAYDIDWNQYRISQAF